MSCAGALVAGRRKAFGLRLMSPMATANGEIRRCSCARLAPLHRRHRHAKCSASNSPGRHGATDLHRGANPPTPQPENTVRKYSLASWCVSVTPHG